jgi:hypothetical protein
MARISRRWISICACRSKLLLSAIQLPQPMDDPAITSSQFADGQLEVIDTPAGAMWQICLGGICVQAHNGEQLLAQYRALRISQGRPVPPG